MGWIERELIDNEVAITLERDDRKLCAVRRIRRGDALMVSLLITIEAPDRALQIDVANGVSNGVGKSRPQTRLARYG